MRERERERAQSLQSANCQTREIVTDSGWGIGGGFRIYAIPFRSDMWRKQETCLYRSRESYAAELSLPLPCLLFLCNCTYSLLESKALKRESETLKQKGLAGHGESTRLQS
ncbi:hypothetical protein CIPAW_05G108700 [Carya illinoinensis]|uniref:Uncharacterized protein n=1 Tax=Carya illinoinensis TaxID=32201 RepID=A0A8T1QHN5_CARIL|nr:hypothetical protein CIPAW_05G108700 [Carya illinoinensis]